MSKKICTISIPKGWLDNDYTFYEDGKIEHFYDKHETKPNITEYPTANQISDSQKNKIIEKCPEEHKKTIKTILYGDNK